MNWMKERDALIAQTMAFVQSVTGKKPESDRPRLPLTPAALDALPAGRLVQAGVESVRIGAGADANILQPPPSAPPATDPVKLARMPRPAPAGDFRTEMKERIATFRKHQERFNQEREEYFNSTLAKARAAIEAAPPPRAGK